MFIREVRKKNPGYERVFAYHRSIGISQDSPGTPAKALA